MDDIFKLDLTPQERSGIVVREILESGSISNRQVRELTGVRTRNGAWRILASICRGVLPLTYDEKERKWILTVTY